jgi:hypothetical protein
MGLSEQRTGALLYPTGHRKATAAANFAPTSLEAELREIEEVLAKTGD